jgi:hypothetical protein
MRAGLQHCCRAGRERNDVPLARGVTIARTGEQLYAVHELPAAADDDGIIRVQRDAADAFDPDAASSFAGVSITMRHPDGAIDPTNWRHPSIGHVRNVRRDGDHLVADLVVHDQPSGATQPGYTVDAC